MLKKKYEYLVGPLDLQFLEQGCEFFVDAFPLLSLIVALDGCGNDICHRGKLPEVLKCLEAQVQKSHVSKHRY